jgi:hypothetical protein
MVHLLAAAALAFAASAPCPVASQNTAQAFVASNIAQEIAVLEVLQDAEQEFAARVQDLGLTGAAPLFGASRDAALASEGPVSIAKARETGDARRVWASSWPAR